MDDAEAACNLGEEACDDLEDEAVDKAENSGEERTDEAANLRKQGKNLGLDRDDDNGENGTESTKDEL